MAKSGDKFLDRIKKDVRDIDHGKLKHHPAHHEKRKIHHMKHKSQNHGEHKTKHHLQHHEFKEKGTEHKISSEHTMKTGTNTDKILAENLVALQKIMANLALSIDGLSKRISKLLDLFEISAKTLAEKDYELGKDVKMEKELNQKLDTLIEHNKIFARGLTLLHEKSGIETEERRPLPQTPTGTPQPGQMPRRMETDNYQKSLSSKP
ncbi:hypothetical protein HYT25_00215 [Candidatus Pacearchaeota archaeon]|nr:hypothetical protein [Candidatus Pacearchaeota archaeon]